MAAQQIIESWRPRVIDDAIFFRPDVPMRKLAGAISSYAPGTAPEDVLVLVDNTVFGGAGDGMIITPALFIGRDMGELPVRVEIAQVHEIRLEGGVFSRKIFVDGGRLLVTLNCTSESGTKQLVEMMRALVARHPADEPDVDPLAASPAPTASPDCQSCGAPIPPAEVACTYCGRARA